MAFCGNCGTNVSDGSRFCPHCGQVLQGSGSEGNNRQGNGANRSYSAQGREFTGFFDPRDISDNHFLCILCYLNILFVIPLVMRPHSPYVKFHANQGILLFILTLLNGVCWKIPVIGWLAGIIVSIYSFIAVVLGIIACLNGQARELPIIGGITILNWK